MTTSFSKPNIYARFAAFAAILLIGTGKTLHFHQEGDNCCKNHDQIEAAAELEAKPCPFGCEHHAETAESEHNKPAPKPHDQHDCRICQVLAQPTSSPLVVGVPQVTENLLAEIRISSESPTQALAAAYESRGPPLSA